MTQWSLQIVTTTHQRVQISFVQGRNCLVHCAGGSGRTGMVIAAVIKNLGVSNTFSLVSFVGHDAARETNYMRLDISPKRMRMKNTIFHLTKHLQVFDPVARIRKVHKSKKHSKLEARKNLQVIHR